MKILITGTAGFIGFHLANRLASRGDSVTGLDNINDYYDVSIKYARLKAAGIETDQIDYGRIIQSAKFPNYKFIKLNLEDRESINSLFRSEGFEVVCHLAAQAGLRHSLTNPHIYIDSNITGFLNILEGCRNNGVRSFVFASSSSVYGLNEKQPFNVHHIADHPISLYAATKRANELMAHTYSHLYGLPATGIRFFTVYGPWGRPDMALFKFTKAIIEDHPIDLHNRGDMFRDFTYIDDIVEGVVRLIDNPAAANPLWDGKNPDPASSSAPFRIYNIGNNNPVRLTDFIEAIEKKLGKKAKFNLLPMHPGEMHSTYADVTDLIHDTGYKPKTDLQYGVNQFIDWYLNFYSVF